jgi:hypothetical protein
MGPGPAPESGPWLAPPSAPALQVQPPPLVNEDYGVGPLFSPARSLSPPPPPAGLAGSAGGEGGWRTGRGTFLRGCGRQGSRGNRMSQRGQRKRNSHTRRRWRTA